MFIIHLDVIELKAKKLFSKDTQKECQHLDSERGISDSITKNWTPQAIECYESGCNCIECSIGKGNYSFICQMPQVIEILLNTIGPPTSEDMEIARKAV